MKKIKLITAMIGVLSLQIANAQSVNISTQTGNEIGATISAYKYQEPTLGMQLTSYQMLGINYTGTYAFGNDFYVKADGRYANGPANYSGTGTTTNNTNYYYDIRGLAGYDVKFSNYVISPYIGYGYRYLWNVLSGTGGYNRESNYYYIPVGATHRIATGSSGNSLETTLEYDYLIQGKQNSLGSTFTINNTQNSGYGVRLSSMYQMGEWAVGPYLTYWNIQASDWARSGNLIGQEPANSTTEAGFKVSYKF